MLIKCPECELQVSDKAILCPHCGYPFKSDKISPTRSHKHKRLPNGFGQISEIKGRNLRNKFRVMVCTGKTAEGRPICRTLKPKAYFKTYNEAYQALMDYNHNPYDLESNIAMNDLFKKWSVGHKKTLKSENNRRAIDSLWNYFTEIQGMRVADVRVKHMRACIDNAKYDDREASPVVKQRMKTMLNQMFDYAVEYELTDKNYARTFTLSSDVSEEREAKIKHHETFTPVEVDILWQNITRLNVDIILINSYMGWRPNELLSILMENINLEEGYIIGGMKTDAGTDRKVYIHSRILPLVKARYERAKTLNSPYLFPNGRISSTHVKYRWYERTFKNIMRDLNLNEDHRLHDCRVTFITMLKNAGADEYAIKYLAGHAISDITEKIYTKRDPLWLKHELEKIK